MLASAIVFLSLATLVTSVHDENDNRDLRIIIRPPYYYQPGKPGTGCVEPNTFFNTSVSVKIRGDPSVELDASIIMDLEDSFEEAYNNLRTDFCDDASRVVDQVQVEEGSKSIEGLDEFSLRFQVRVGCDRCSVESTNLFAEEPDTRREMLEEQPTVIVDDESRELRLYKRPFPFFRGSSSTSSPTPSPTPAVSLAANNSPRIEKECCPTNGERRAPYASEFTKEFDATYKALGNANRLLQTDPIEQILSVFELLAVTCNIPSEEFIANVAIELGGDPAQVSDSEIFALETSFQTTYNGLGDQLCDPLFRTVTQVEAELLDAEERSLKEEDTDDKERGLQQRKTGRFNYKVKGKCRGCGSGNKRLFAQGSLGRRLEMKHDQRLQFDLDEESCLCAVGAEERGIFEDEFTVSYDDNVQELNQAGVLPNIETVEALEEEILWTWSPTDSPTNYPTGPTDSPVPSPSPSMVPTESRR